MKIKPQIYAQLLVEGLKTNTDLAKVAENLWHALQKNKQYRDLPKILELVDVEYAKQNNSTLAEVYSSSPLLENEQAEIKVKLEKKLDCKVMIKNIIDENYGGITVKIDDKIIDLSAAGKIEKLKAKLTNI